MGGKQARSSFVALLVSVVAACASKARDAQPLPAPLPAPPPVASAVATVAVPERVVPSLDELAARQVRLAPGMRELARGEASANTPLPKVERDTCVRIVFATHGAASVSLVASDGQALAAAAHATDGALGDKGPVCFHADQAPALVVSGDAGTVRYVVWGAP